MASSQEQQETARSSPVATTVPEGTTTQPSVGQGSISIPEENGERQLGPATPGNPVPGLRSSQEELFSQEETEHQPAEATTDESARSPSASQVREAQRASESREATPRPAAVEESATIPGLPPFFPSPPSVTRNTPPGVHRGPASTSSLSSYRAPLNPRARPFAPANEAVAMLRRGPPPGTRGPEILHGPGVGEVVVTPAEAARYRASAARHAAMVFKRLMDADSDIQANALDREFTRVFGQQYQDEVVRVIGDPPESTASNNSHDDG